MSNPRGSALANGFCVADDDAMGRMVHEDVEVDINGIPNSLPKIRYERMPMVIRKVGSYEDWLRRGARPVRLIKAIQEEVQELAKEVAKLQWERRLRMRPIVSQKALDFNKNIINVLKSNSDEKRWLTS